MEGENEVFGSWGGGGDHEGPLLRLRAEAEAGSENGHQGMATILKAKAGRSLTVGSGKVSVYLNSLEEEGGWSLI